MGRIAFIGLLVLLSISKSSQAEIFYYKDEQGNIHATDSPANIPEQFRSKSTNIESRSESQTRVSLQLEQKGTHLLVPVTLGAGTSAELIFDTGAERTMISAKLARDLNLKKIREIQISTANEVVARDTMLLPTLSIQGFVVRDLEVIVNDLSHLGVGEGLLGMDFLKNFDMRIDHQTRTLTLDRKGGGESATGQQLFHFRDSSGKLHSVDSIDLVPVEYRNQSSVVNRRDDSHLRLKLTLERIGNSFLIPASINGRNVIMIFDTGAAGSTISSKLASELGLAKQRSIILQSASGDSKTFSVRADEVAVGNFVVNNLELTVQDLPTGKKIEGLLGLDYFTNFKIKFDSTTGVLELQKR